MGWGYVRQCTENIITLCYPGQNNPDVSVFPQLDQLHHVAGSETPTAYMNAGCTWSLDISNEGAIIAAVT
jgi:hypothetical protein